MLCTHALQRIPKASFLHWLPCWHSFYFVIHNALRAAGHCCLAIFYLVSFISQHFGYFIQYCAIPLYDWQTDCLYSQSADQQCTCAYTCTCASTSTCTCAGGDPVMVGRQLQWVSGILGSERSSTPLWVMLNCGTNNTHIGWAVFLDAVASPSTYTCQWVGKLICSALQTLTLQWVSLDQSTHSEWRSTVGCWVIPVLDGQCSFSPVSLLSFPIRRACSDIAMGVLENGSQHPSTQMLNYGLNNTQIRWISSCRSCGVIASVFNEDSHCWALRLSGLWSKKRNSKLWSRSETTNSQCGEPHSTPIPRDPGVDVGV